MSNDRTGFALLLCATAVGCAGVTNTGGGGGPEDDWLESSRDGIRVVYQAPDQPNAAHLLTTALAVRAQATAFFGVAIDGEYAVKVFPTREAFNVAFQNAGVTPACWMIARATRASIEILAPRLWSGEQCGHDAGETTPVLLHETVHVLHARRNALAEVNHTPALKWFNEGIAVFASGQLTPQMRQAAAAVAAQGPETITLTALGNNLYSVGGALAAFIDAQYGRPATVQALAATSNGQLFAQLGISEAALLQSWAASVGP